MAVHCQPQCLHVVDYVLVCLALRKSVEIFKNFPTPAAGFSLLLNDDISQLLLSMRCSRNILARASCESPLPPKEPGGGGVSASQCPVSFPFSLLPRALCVQLRNIVAQPYLSISLYLYLSIPLSLYLSISLSLYLSTFLSLYRSIFLSL